jgi:hypothetical protein
MCSVVSGLGYLVTNVHLKEAEALRIHGGLLKYLQNALPSDPGDILITVRRSHVVPSVVPG